MLLQVEQEENGRMKNNIVREVVLRESQPNKALQGKRCYIAAVSSLYQPIIETNWVI